jgi:hypothetical protein
MPPRYLSFAYRSRIESTAELVKLNLPVLQQDIVNFRSSVEDGHYRGHRQAASLGMIKFALVLRGCRPGMANDAGR